MPDWPEILRRDGPAVWQTAYRLLNHHADADECFQDAFLAAMELSRRPIASFRGRSREEAPFFAFFPTSYNVLTPCMARAAHTVSFPPRTIIVTPEMSRRAWLAASAAAAAPLLASPAGASDRGSATAFRFCLNTATIQGQKLPVEKEVEIAAEAGYQGFEPWIGELEQYVRQGGKLEDLGKRIRDHGLTVESAIGFAEWIVDDEERRKKGLENARRAMDMVQQIGGKRIAAPPAGATDKANLDLFQVAQRYRVLLQVGESMGVTPMVELWGFSKTLSRLGETALVAIESGHPRACVLADVYHVYKGGSSFETLKLLSREALQVFHMNDYPARPARKDIKDEHRVYPGDGVAPLKPLLRDLRRLGFQGVLSLELFNRDYWKQDARTVARTGLEKMKAVVAAAQE